MKLYAKCLPEYFEMLDRKSSEFRQFESIAIENQVTGDIREFRIKDVRKIEGAGRNLVEKKYPLVDWDPDMPIFAIDLGDELDRNVIGSVQPAPEISAAREDRRFEIPESKRTWHGVEN